MPDETRQRIDAALVSHAHLDHLDVRSLRSLGGAPVAIGPPAIAGGVRRAGLRAETVRAGESWRRGDVEVRAVRADHDGRRWPWSRDRGSVGFVVSGPEGSVYFAGDTGEFDEMDEIGPVDVALLPVAGWGPRLPPGHLDPEGAARVAATVRPRVAVPIHWGTYATLYSRLTGIERPPREFAGYAAELAPGVGVEILEPGESLTV